MTYFYQLRYVLILCLVWLSVTGCSVSSGGGGTPSPADNSADGTQTGGAAAAPGGAARLDLIASAKTMPSSAVDGDAGVDLTAIVRDADNNAVTEPDVAFRASGGRLDTSAAAADNGTAAATLYNDPDRANRTITVTARSGGISDAIDIDVTGTQLTLTGPDAIANGGDARFTATLRDAAGNPIAAVPLTIESRNNNPISAASVDTDNGGEAIFAVAGQTSGADTIAAAARNARSEAALKVGGKRLSFVAPDHDRQPRVGSSVMLTVGYIDDNGPIAGSDVRFSTSRGDIDARDTTDASGRARAALTSQVAGASMVSAATGGVQATRRVTFRAAAPSTLVVGASPSTVRPAKKSTLTATVRDRYSNPVKNQTVAFNLAAASAGSLSTGQARTGADGRASVTYTAGPSSASEPVQVTATVADSPNIADAARIRVAGRALSIRLGAGSPLKLSSDGTTYNAPYAALITDAAGNPVPDADFQLSVQSVAYEAAGQQGLDCPAEDDNHNGVLEDGEDDNENEQLDPSRVASVPTTPSLDDTGTAHFNVSYLRRYAGRVEIELTGTANVEGNEGSQTLTFVLGGTPADAGDSRFDACQK